MVLLKAGMKETEAKRVLGIGRRRAKLLYSLNRYRGYSGQFNDLYSYDLGSEHRLEILIQHEDHVLVSATLYRGGGWGVIASFHAKEETRIPRRWVLPASETQGNPLPARPK